MNFMDSSPASRNLRGSRSTSARNIVPINAVPDDLSPHGLREGIDGRAGGDAAREGRTIEFRQRDPLVMTLHAAADRLAHVESALAQAVALLDRSAWLLDSRGETSIASEVRAFLASQTEGEQR